MSDLGLDLSKVLFAAEPRLLECEMEASARAALAVADLLGCVMATVLKRQGQAMYLEAMRAVMARVNESAIRTVQIAETTTPNTTRQ